MPHMPSPTDMCGQDSHPVNTHLPSGHLGAQTPSHTRSQRPATASHADLKLPRLSPPLLHGAWPLHRTSSAAPESACVPVSFPDVGP